MYALQSVAIKNTVPLAEAQAHYKKITKKKPRKVREEGEWWRFRYMPPTRFKKGTFRTKVVNDNIHLIFGELEGTHAKLEGRGLFDYFTKAYDYVANKASDAFSYVKNAVSITDYSATTKKLLEEYGKNEITRMTIRRVPIAFAIDLALQGVSAGKWEELKEKYGFDKFYHLSLIVYLKNAWEKTALRKGRKIPKQLSLEKLEVVSVNERVEPVEGQEEQEVPIPKGQKITIDGMFDKTRQRMGETAFFAYSALGHNNCQDFVSNLLQSEGLYREPEKEFVFQDLSELAKELPESTHAISQGITHLGALANKYLGIGGAKNEIIIPKEEFVKEHKHLVGLLKKSDDPALQKEADIQAKELKQKGGKKPCWKDYEQIGMKEKDGKSVPNCVPTGGAKVGLNDLLSKDRMEQVGGTRQSGFIRAMMARDKAEEAGQDVDTVENRKKFKYLDKKGFKIQKLTKTTHDLAHKKKARLPDTSHRQQVEQFYDYVIANAPAHKPDWDGGIHYGDTYDLDDLFTKWNESRGAEERGKRQARREADSEIEIPPSFFHLPEPEKPKVAPVAVVPVAVVPKKKPSGAPAPAPAPSLRLKAPYEVAKLKVGSQVVVIGQSKRLSDDYHYPKKFVKGDSFKDDYSDYEITDIQNGVYRAEIVRQGYESDQKGTVPFVVFSLVPEGKKFMYLKVSESSSGTADNWRGKQMRESDFTPERVGVFLHRGDKRSVSKWDREEELVGDDGKVVVVAVADVAEEDEKTELPVVGKYPNPQNAYQEEINKLVDFGVRNLHFNDYITEMLNPVYNPSKHGGSIDIVYACMTYYFALQYKLPILNLNPPNMPEGSFNNIGHIKPLVGNNEYLTTVAEEIKKNFQNGAKQVLFFMGIGIDKSYHSNLILVRAVEKKVYIIDPHGTQSMRIFHAQYGKQEKIVAFIAKQLGFQLVRSEESCPYLIKEKRLGFQAIEGLAEHREGFCGWWNGFMIELCCLKPDVSFEALYKEARELLSDDPVKLYNVVVKFQYNIQQIIVGILEKSDKAEMRGRTSFKDFTIYREVASIVNERLRQLKAKRKEILGYAKL
jgi:hypothetical protein